MHGNGHHPCRVALEIVLKAGRKQADLTERYDSPLAGIGGRGQSSREGYPEQATGPCV